MSWKFLLQDMKRSFMNMGFAAGFCGLSALLAYSYFVDSLHGDPYFAVVNILAASGFVVFLPVFPVLGYASRFCGEYESGYYRLILSRMKPQKYAQARIISVALSGGVIVAVPFLLICLVAVYLATPVHLDTGVLKEAGVNALRVDEHIEMVKIGLTYGVGAMVAVKVLLGFLFGAAWALIGLAFAVWMPNKYVSLIAPFVLYQSLHILVGKSIDPAFLVRGDDVGHLGSVVMECVWLFIAAAAAMAGFRRRCRDE